MLAATLSFGVDVSHHPLPFVAPYFLHKVVQYMRFTPFLKHKLWRQTMGGWFNLNELLIRRERANNAYSSLIIGLVLPAYWHEIGFARMLHRKNCCWSQLRVGKNRHIFQPGPRPVLRLCSVEFLCCVNFHCST